MHFRVLASPSTARSFSALTDQLFASVIPSCFRFRHRIGAGSFSPLDTSKNLLGVYRTSTNGDVELPRTVHWHRTPIGRERSDLRPLHLSMAGHRPFHVAHKTYLSSRKCLLVCDATQDGHSLPWNHTCNPNSREKVQRSARCRPDE